MKKLTTLFVLSLLVIVSCNKGTDQFTTKNFDSQFGDANSGDRYAEHKENDFIATSEQPVSTFSIDADGASYSNIRRFIEQDHRLPPKGAVRLEEMLNYFELDYEYDDSNHPLALNGEVSACPWNLDHKLVRVGIKGKPIPKNSLPPSNFVFLIDVSGSMSSDDKLALLKKGFTQLADEIRPDDRVAIVTYAGNAGVLLESTPGSQRQKIKNAIAQLGAGGSTAGAEGIRTAYEIAESNFIEGGNNRIVLGTDGDFNVGVSRHDSLVSLIEKKRESGVFLSVLGVGRGNLNDHMMEQVANHGNGTYEYIDKVKQMKKVFIYDYDKFYTVAKDVKAQVEFNPNNVKEYRLIGYANRVLQEEDFEDDSKDAGEIGAGQNITALYEIVPTINTFRNAPTFTIDFRYKQPESDHSVPMELDIYDDGKSFSQSSDFMKFTSSIASYAMLLTDSEHKGSSSYNKVTSWLNETHLNDPHGFKGEFEEIVRMTQGL